MPLLGDLVAEQGSDSPVHVSDRRTYDDWYCIVNRATCLFDEALVEGLVKTMILLNRAVECLFVTVVSGNQHWRNVEARCFPVVNCGPNVERFHPTDHLVNGPEAKLRHQLAHFLRNEFEKVDDEFGLASKSCTEFRVLGCNAHRTCVEVADTHHHASRHDERRGSESKLFGAEQSGDDDISTSFQLAIGLHDDAVAQTVHHQCLLSLGKT